MSSPSSVALTIDPEFRNLIPPLRPEERDLLEQSIRREGVRDALIVWKDHGILLDGHNRYEIAHVNGKPYKTREVELPDRAACMDWIVKTQLGRRNLTPDQFRLLLGRRYNALKKPGGMGWRRAGQNDRGGQKQGDVAVTLASEHGVAEKTVRRAGNVAEWIDSRPDVAAKVMAGTTTIREAKAEAAGRDLSKPRAGGRTGRRVLPFIDVLKRSVDAMRATLGPIEERGIESFAGLDADGSIESKITECVRVLVRLRRTIRSKGHEGNAGTD